MSIGLGLAPPSRTGFPSPAAPFRRRRCAKTLRFHFSLDFFLPRLPAAAGSQASLVGAILVIGAEEIVEVAEGRRVVVDKRHMVEVVVVGARPEGEDVLERPGEVWSKIRTKKEKKRERNITITAVGIHGLMQPQDDPDVDGDDVEVLE